MAVLLLASCASKFRSTPSELTEVRSNEGVVVGSFYLETESAPEKERALAFLGGAKAGKRGFTVSVVRIPDTRMGALWKMLTGDADYTLDVEPGQERVFVKKLPVGHYRVSSISTQWGNGSLSYSPNLQFSVLPNQTTYIGKSITRMPYRIRGGSQVDQRVEDEQEKAMVALAEGFPTLPGPVVTELMRQR
ncbi:MAG: hypothetical protein OEY97_03255 [Nitrospirota bacterium]|nr:hypothetical protein [Nitrospirota bacterium]